MSHRRGVSIRGTLSLEVWEQHRFRTPADLTRLLLPRLEEPFTNRMLAAAVGVFATLVGKMTYTLRRTVALEVVGRRSCAYLFARA